MKSLSEDIAESAKGFGQRHKLGDDPTISYMDYTDPDNPIHITAENQHLHDTYLDRIVDAALNDKDRLHEVIIYESERQGRNAEIARLKQDDCGDTSNRLK